MPWRSAASFGKAVHGRQPLSSLDKAVRLFMSQKSKLSHGLGAKPCSGRLHFSETMDCRLWDRRYKMLHRNLTMFFILFESHSFAAFHANGTAETTFRAEP